MTLDILHTDGQHHGGMILPGYQLQRRSLAQDTEKLSLLQGQYQMCPANTADAIESGILNGLTGAIERQHKQCLQQFHRPFALLLSGGDAKRLSPLLNMPHQVVDNLVLDGLLRVAQA